MVFPLLQMKLRLKKARLPCPTPNNRWLGLKKRKEWIQNCPKERDTVLWPLEKNLASWDPSFAKGRISCWNFSFHLGAPLMVHKVRFFTFKFLYWSWIGSCYLLLTEKEDADKENEGLESVLNILGLDFSFTPECVALYTAKTGPIFKF